VIWIPPGVKHWHGATSTTQMTHIAIQEALDGQVVKWLEHVTDEQYLSSTTQKWRNKPMPHVIVKMWPGKTEEQKAHLAEAITKAVMSILGYGEESVSVAIEEIEPQEWAEKVYKPDILERQDQLYKKPGYDL
jgi:4-oxalocrotonate tautomerase